MSLLSALLLIFLAVAGALFLELHRHRCIYCQKEDAPSLSGWVTVKGVERRYRVTLEPAGDWPNVPKAFVDERLSEQAFHSATLPESQN